MIRILHSIGTPLLGYAIIVICALIFQEGLFGGVNHDSPLLAIVVGGGMTAVSCVLAGYVLAAVAPSRPVLHAVPLLIWLGIETTILTVQGTFPALFGIMAGGSNIVGVAIGVYIWMHLHKSGSARESGDKRSVGLAPKRTMGPMG